jgi:hypothetical protein
VSFVKNRPGRMGVLTVPAGVRLHRRAGGSERAKKEFDVLALPSHSPEGAKAFSFKMRDEFWYVLKEDVGTPETE